MGPVPRLDVDEDERRVGHHVDVAAGVLQPLKVLVEVGLVDAKVDLLLAELLGGNRVTLGDCCGFRPGMESAAGQRPGRRPMETLVPGTWRALP